jgi:hypothetical protein
MDVGLIVLRVIHIVSGILWMGGAALFLGFVRPTLNVLGPDAQKVVDELVRRRRLALYFIVVSTLTVLAGAILYWRNSAGLQVSWITSPSGLGFTIGAAAALIAWPVGNLLLGRAFNALYEIGQEMKASGGPPSPELARRLRDGQARVLRIAVLLLFLLTVAAISMATARYLR